MAEDAKSNYVGVRLSKEETDLLEQVIDALEPLTGKRSQSDAVRYMIRNFPFETSPLGKKARVQAEEEEDAALGRHASKIYDAVRSRKETPQPLAEVEAELVAAGVLDG